ncbi:Phycobilisome degradation protein nblA [Pleurocapsa sp. PCC 7327]|nr:NblA/ycf18 family protein [Pleurocapsa sp. PCC 7327]AFY78566.1 Phycobilisome degradation protein nblA [Pleurocapsa sp. PCC 7327]
MMKQIEINSPVQKVLRSKLMEIPNQLTMEQEFKLRVFKEQVKNLNQNQAQECLIELFRQMMVKDNLYKHLLKNI